MGSNSVILRYISSNGRGRESTLFDVYYYIASVFENSLIQEFCALVIPINPAMNFFDSSLRMEYAPWNANQIPRLAVRHLPSDDDVAGDQNVGRMIHGSQPHILLTDYHAAKTACLQLKNFF